MRFTEILDALGGGQQTQEANVLSTTFLQLFHGGNRGIAGRQHWIDNDDKARIETFGGLEVIFAGLQRIVIAIHTDMGNTRRRHEFQHAFQQAVAGAQDGGENQLLALQHRSLDGFERRIDGFHRHFKVARHFIAEQRRDFPEQAAEAGR
ncbi:hypothetical protein D3C71_648750 [compost metagenome]